MLNIDRDSMDLGGFVEATIDDFGQAFEEYWGLRGGNKPEHMEFEEWVDRLSLDAVAEKLSVAALRLFRPETLARQEQTWPEELTRAAAAEEEAALDLVRLVQQTLTEDARRRGAVGPALDTVKQALMPHLARPDQERLRFLRTAVQRHLAWLLLPDLGVMSIRLLRLSRYLTRETDPEVQNHLSRVARCYLLGLGPELALVSRSVLELTLSRRVPEGYVRTVRGIGSNSRVPLHAWIDVALEDGALTMEESKSANRIRRVGNEVAHGGEGRLDSDGILEDLHAVVAGLARSRTVSSSQLDLKRNATNGSISP